MREWWLKIWRWIKGLFQPPPKHVSWWFWGIFLFLALAAFGASAYLGSYYRQRVFPGVRLGILEVGGLSFPEAERKLENWQEELNTQGMVFKANYQDGQVQTVTAYPIIISPTDPDLSREIFKFSARENADRAYQIGRNGQGWQKVWDILSAAMWGRHLDLQYKLDNEQLETFLRDSLSGMERPAKNAALRFAGQGAASEIFLEPEENGIGFNYTEAIAGADKALKQGRLPALDLTLKPIAAEITREEAQDWLQSVRTALTVGELTLTFEEEKWVAPVETWKLWLEFVERDGTVALVFNVSSAAEFLDKIAGKINQPAKEAKFAMADGRVSEFQAAAIGRELDREATLVKLAQEVFQENKKEVAVVVKETQPAANAENINELGIKELVGVGKSNFAGSPNNRRKNIAVGARLLNGLLIKPGEEFMTIKNLLPINAANGYLPELVIKGNRTVPEYGGGLCQVGTTVFRAALNAGLPITERQEHSYRVPYYEPAGTDATIYDPHPDLRFVNDTGGYLLWQTRIEGNNLIFELWGTKDARQVTVGQPRIFNITSPGPVKLIESPDLKVGEKKCIETAHKGASATLSRQVVYPENSGKENIDEVFSSYYRAWPQVCLVGPGGASSSTPNGTGAASSTAPVVVFPENASTTANP